MPGHSGQRDHRVSAGAHRSDNKKTRRGSALWVRGSRRGGRGPVLAELRELDRSYDYL